MVIMELEKYNSICELYRHLRKSYNAVNLQDAIDQLIVKYPEIPAAAVRCIVSYLHQLDTKTKVGRTDWSKAYEDYSQGKGTLISIAMDLDVSPTLVARRLLQNMTTKSNVQLWLHDTSNIPDGKLAIEVMTAQYCDPIYGQLSQCITSNSGELFESEIASILNQAKVCYATENSLRTKEFDVTPDFKLNIPLAIKVSKDFRTAYILPPLSLPLCQLCSLDDDCDKMESQRLVICWIECKSRFASPNCHKDYLKSQFNPYTNRFGRGLVLYKHGFVKSIIDKHSKITIAQELIYHKCQNEINSN